MHRCVYSISLHILVVYSASFHKGFQAAKQNINNHTSKPATISIRIRGVWNFLLWLLSVWNLLSEELSLKYATCTHTYSHSLLHNDPVQSVSFGWNWLHPCPTVNTWSQTNQSEHHYPCSTWLVKRWSCDLPETNHRYSKFFSEVVQKYALSFSEGLEVKDNVRLELLEAILPPQGKSLSEN